MSVRMRVGQRDNLFQLYAPTTVTGTLQSRVEGWTEEAAEWGGFLPEFLTLRNYGAGEVPTGTREIQFRGPSAVDERSGLEVTRGPEAGTKWRVLSVDRSDRKMTHVRVEPYNGAFA